MKTLKALLHWVKGYRLHPKELRRLETLWFNIKVGIFTILFVLLIVFLLDTFGFFHEALGTQN